MQVSQLPSGNGSTRERKENQEAKQRLYDRIVSQDKILFDDFHPFGYVFFNKDITKRQNINLFGHYIIRTLELQSWYIRFKNDEERQEWNKWFGLMKESQITNLQTGGKSYSQILKSISHIGFYELTNLNLFNCGITSIEAFSFLDAPHLKIINLIFNKIYHFKSLTKSNFPNLQRLFLYQTNDGQFLNSEKINVRFDQSQRWNFSLESLRLQRNFYNSIIMNDLSFLSKVKQKKNNALNLNISIQSRILQVKAYRKISEQLKMNFFLADIEDPREIPTQVILENENSDLFRIETRL